MHRSLSSFLVAMLLTLAPASVEAKPSVIGTLAPDFKVTSFDGREVSLAELRGKVVLLTSGRPGAVLAVKSCRSTRIKILSSSTGLKSWR